jgi:hypothetical protein
VSSFSPEAAIFSLIRRNFRPKADTAGLLCFKGLLASGVSATRDMPLS